MFLEEITRSEAFTALSLYIHEQYSGCFDETQESIPSSQIVRMTAATSIAFIEAVTWNLLQRDPEETKAFVRKFRATSLSIIGAGILILNPDIPVLLKLAGIVVAVVSLHHEFTPFVLDEARAYRMSELKGFLSGAMAGVICLGASKVIQNLTRPNLR